MPLTVTDWFDALDPAPPKALGDELRSLLAQDASAPAEDVTEVCMRVAESSLLRLQTDGSNDRNSALTLLSIDALVTYAFEAAASDPSRMEQRALDAMARISALAEHDLKA